MRVVLKLVGMVIWLGACSVAETEESQEFSDLLGVLVDYASQNQMSMADVREELAALTWNAEYSSKGGAGRVGPDTYVDVLASENVISINGVRWTGLESNTVQIVFVVGGEVASEGAVSDADEATLVVFTPTHIRYFDFRVNQAGKYRRAIAND